MHYSILAVSRISCEEAGLPGFSRPVWSLLYRAAADEDGDDEQGQPRGADASPGDADDLHELSEGRGVSPAVLQRDQQSRLERGNGEGRKQ